MSECTYWQFQRNSSMLLNVFYVQSADPYRSYMVSGFTLTLNEVIVVLPHCLCALLGPNASPASLQIFIEIRLFHFACKTFCLDYSYFGFKASCLFIFSFGELQWVHPFVHVQGTKEKKKRKTGADGGQTKNKFLISEPYAKSKRDTWKEITWVIIFQPKKSKKKKRAKKERHCKLGWLIWRYISSGQYKCLSFDMNLYCFILPKTLYESILHRWRVVQQA